MNKLKSINVNDWLEAKGALKFNVNVMYHKKCRRQPFENTTTVLRNNENVARERK